MAKGQKKEKKELMPEERLQNALVPKEEWPYKLPEGWKWVRLGNIADWTSGGTPSRKHPEYYKEGTIPWIKTGELNDDVIMDSEERITVEAVENSSAKILPVHTVIVAMYGATIGKTGILGINASTNQACACAVCNDAINYKYLFYYLRSIKDSLIKQGKGGAQPNISQTVIKNRMMPIPAPALQAKIVDFIEKEFDRLDEAKDQIQSVIDSSEERKQSILYKAFKGELTKKWRKENGVSLDSWHKEKLKSVCDINPKKEDVSGYDDNMEVSFFPMASLDERVGAITDPQIRPLKEVKKGFTNFREGDVVFAKITPCMENGKSAVIGELMNDIGYGTTEFYVFRCGKQIDKYYLFHLLRSKKFRNDAKQEMTGAVGQQRVPKKYLEDYEVNLPSIDEQQEIVRLLNSFIAKEDGIADASDQIMSNLEGNKKSILSKAFRGELYA